MSSKHKSISERLRRAKSPEARRELLTDWVDNWRGDQLDVLALLNAGIERGDQSDLTSAAGQMSAIIDKRFPALRRIIDKLLDDDAAIGRGTDA